MVDHQTPIWFAPGDRVRVMNGPFSDFKGTVESVDKERWNAQVALAFFGRIYPTTLSWLDLQRDEPPR
jgi:transcription termination/antitermination protein NusG